MSLAADPELARRVEDYLSRRARAAVGVGELVSVTRVLAALQIDGWRGSPQELAEWIAPIVCRSPDEQREFRRGFVEHFAPATTPAPPPPPEDELIGSWTRWVAIVIALIVVVVLAVAIFGSAPPAPLESVSTPQPTSLATRSLLPTPTTGTAYRSVILVSGWTRGFVSGVLRGHEANVQSAAFSLGGTWIVTASDDGTARIWAADGSGAPIILRGHEGRVSSAAFSPDGARIVTASDDNTARIWAADGSGAPLILRGHEARVSSAAFSPDGARIVTASNDYTARIWAADGSGDSVTLRGHQSMVWSAAFSQDGTRIVTASNDYTVRIWAADGSGDPVILRDHGGDLLTSAAFSPDGARIVTTTDDGTVRIRAADGSGDPVTLRGHKDAVWSAAFSPDGARIVTASDDSTARIWAADGSGAPVTLRGHKGAVLSAAFSPDGARIVTASDDGTARIWAADGSAPSIVLSGHLDGVNSAAFSLDGTRIVTAAHDSTARNWAADGSGAPVILCCHEGGVLSAAFGPDGARIVTASQDGTALIWTADGSGAPQSLYGHDNYVSSAEFALDGSRIVTASYDGTTRIWAADGSGAPVILRGHEDAVLSAAFSADGTRIVTASADTTARVWAADGSGAPVILRGHEGAVQSAAFSPDGARVATASHDGTVAVWSDDDGALRPKQVFRGHNAEVMDVAFQPDGGAIASASTDRTARVWPVADGDPTHWLPWIGALAVLLSLPTLVRSLWGQIALRRRRGGRDARPVKLRFETGRVPVGDPRRTRQQAGRLRSTTPVENDAVDVERSLERTIAAGGMPTFVRQRRRQSPAYLALIERMAPQDHLARHAGGQLDRYAGENLIVERAWFLGDASSAALAADPATRLSTAQLLARFRDRRVLLIGDYALQTSAATELPWLEAVRDWPARTVLVPSGAAIEPRLRDATRAAGAEIADVRTPTTPLAANGRDRERRERPADYPRSLALDPSRWMSPVAPERARIERMLAELRRFLGGDGFRWCAACAIYPELHYELTLDLGRRLLRPESIDEDVLLRLARLPWFRRGWMPGWLRHELIETLPGVVQRDIRGYFLRRFCTAASGDAIDLPVAVDARGPLRELWRAAALRQPDAGRRRAVAIRDAVFIDWMDGSLLSLAVPRRLLRSLAGTLATSADASRSPHRAWAALLGASAAGAITATLLWTVPLGPLPAAAVALWGLAVLLAAATRTQGTTRIRGAAEGVALAAGAGAATLLLGGGARAATTDFAWLGASVPVALLARLAFDRFSGSARLLAVVAACVLPNRLLAWLWRDFSDGSALPEEPAPAGRPIAAVGNAALVALATAAAWRWQPDGQAHEWIWASAGVAIGATIASGILAGGRCDRSRTGLHTAAEAAANLLVVLGVSALLGTEPVRWAWGSALVLGGALAAVAWVTGRRVLRRRLHPLYDLIAPIEDAATVVSPGYVIARLVARRGEDRGGATAREAAPSPNASIGAA